MSLEEYEPGRAFPGVIGRTTDESNPAWPRPLRAAAGSPNVLFIVLDDTGFGQLGCYGSPIATPNLDALVAQNEFPVTTPLAFNPGGLTCGANPGSPVTTDYQAPFRFTGTLHTVTVDLSGDLITDTEAEMRMAMSRQ
jgi:hypothetical protein